MQQRAETCRFKTVPERPQQDNGRHPQRTASVGIGGSSDAWESVEKLEITHQEFASF
jgi:hypothetical protein